MFIYKRSDQFKMIGYTFFYGCINTREFTYLIVCIFSQMNDSMKKYEVVCHYYIHHRGWIYDILWDFNLD